MTDSNEELNLDEKVSDELQNDLSTDYEYADDDSDELVTELGKNFQAPKNADQFIDVTKGSVIDKSKLTYMDIITATAKQHGITLRKPNAGCKKCFGRGYEYITTEGSPHPCGCIQMPRTSIQKSNEDQMSKHLPYTTNRTLRRKAQRANTIAYNNRKTNVA